MKLASAFFALAATGVGTGHLRAAEKAVVASLSPRDLVEFEKQPEAIRQLITASLALTTRKLGYRFGSSSPAAGGMDCSGTVYRALTDLGLEVPRSSREMYLWTRRAGTLVPGVPGTGSIPAPRPGDLLFWEGTYDTGKKEFPISHVMIYLGTLAADGKPVVFGASSGRRFRGRKIHGVSVFDFEVPPPGARSRFAGFAAIPGLRPPPAETRRKIFGRLFE